MKPDENIHVFDEEQSIRVIKDMIEVSRKKLQNDGILFIIWGWTMFINYFFLNYLTSILVTSQQVMSIVRPLRILLPLFAIGFTIYYITKERKKVKTYIGISLRYIWVSMFICMVFINLIQFNVLQKINFELQHPIFMILIAFAITISGVVIRYKMIIIGGISFAILGLTASYFLLISQMLIEAIAWFVAFVIPGHMLYAQRKEKNNV
ncbi:hypothetical protein [Saccharicrinis sp. GN24d3]|uniref:hypothetical protein n=1 Tax=Saccharicrinis sp. GN24d3 TaxID=3458416 RepID=UPI00403694F9